MRQAGQMMIEKFAGRVIHPVIVVPGGFAKSMTEAERQELLEKSRETVGIRPVLHRLAKKNIFYKLTRKPWAWDRSPRVFWAR